MKSTCPRRVFITFKPLWILMRSPSDDSQVKVKMKCRQNASRAERADMKELGPLAGRIRRQRKTDRVLRGFVREICRFGQGFSRLDVRNFPLDSHAGSMPQVRYVYSS